MTISERISAAALAVLGFLPNLIGAIIVLIIGALISKGIELGIRRMLRSADLDGRLGRSDLGQPIQSAVGSPVRAVARVVYWLLLLLTLALAAAVLNVPAITAFLMAVIGYLPNMIAALLILGVAAGFSGMFAGMVRRTMGESSTGKVAGAAVPALVMTIALFMALNQLEIARDIVNITFTALIGSIALGMALAFGLGGRQVAGRILEDAYSRGQESWQQARVDLAEARERATAMSSLEEVATADRSASEAEPASETDAIGVPAPAFGETLEQSRPKKLRRASRKKR